GHASMTATPPPTTTGSQEETVTSDTMRRLGRATAPEMIAQLPSNVGNLLVDGNHDGEREWLVHPSGIAFVGGKLAGETDAAGNFSVELPRGGTYVITARIETPDIRGYGSKQPVVVETGPTLRLPAIILSLI